MVKLRMELGVTECRTCQVSRVDFNGWFCMSEVQRIVFCWRMDFVDIFDSFNNSYFDETERMRILEEMVNELRNEVDKLKLK